MILWMDVLSESEDMSMSCMLFNKTVRTLVHFVTGVDGTDKS